MTKSKTTRLDIANEISYKMNISASLSSEMLNALTEIISEKAMEGKCVSIKRFAQFFAVMKSERAGRNPKTNEFAPVKARMRVNARFSAITFKQG